VVKSKLAAKLCPQLSLLLVLEARQVFHAKLNHHQAHQLA
jgi:hypothetical protein